MVPCTVDVDFAHFKRCCKRAARRHRSLPAELTRIFTEVEADALSRGDQIPGYGELHVRKIRVGVPAERIPPSGGYRLILQLLEVDGRMTARCLDLYYKPDQADIETAEALRLAREAAAKSAESRTPVE